MVRLGFSTLACPDYTIEQVIDLAVRAGLEGVELRFLEGTVDLTTVADLSPSRIAETRRRFDEAGLTVACVDTSVRMASLDPAERAAQLQNALANAEIAVALGSPYIRCFGGPLPDGDKESALNAVASGLTEVARMVAPLGVTPLLETHDDFSTSASVTDLWRRGMSGVDVLWDALHTFRYGESAQQSWAALGGRVRHVHIKDSTVADTTGFDFALPGEGIVPIDEVVAVLEDAGFDGFLHFEWEKAWHPEIADAEVAVPAFARYMREHHPR